MSVGNVPIDQIELTIPRVHLAMLPQSVLPREWEIRCVDRQGRVLLSGPPSRNVTLRLRLQNDSRPFQTLLTARQPAARPERIVVTAREIDGSACTGAKTEVGGLHYPAPATCASVLDDIETSLTSAHYRRACASMYRGAIPDRVKAARMVSCRAAGRSGGVMVTVEVCCDSGRTNQP